MRLWLVVLLKILIGLVGVSGTLMLVGGIKDFVQNIYFTNLTDAGFLLFLFTGLLAIIIAAMYAVCVSWTTD
jgi:hypothetical protein